MGKCIVVKRGCSVDSHLAFIFLIQLASLQLLQHVVEAVELINVGLRFHRDLLLLALLVHIGLLG